MEGEETFRKEGRGPRRSSSFSGVVRGFQGISKTMLKGPGKDDAEDKNSVKEEESESTEAAPTLSETSLLATMQQMTQIMANLQGASSSEASR
ncbi:hypothetical protein O181_036309 [Austropuccinia psidii MF-1]|uniref:Uncharacterized protein n=1 Tax=Austropuccinia psidii MF-1 TaxID=1389203 RepID=A0A9Q3D4C2_9BASI|nr:hypothetical protein [Austropuccinia psidii MF-1]